MTKFDFADKGVVVTGASQGIGLATARAFAAAGARVVVADIAAPKEAAAEFKFLFKQCDIRNEEGDDGVRSLIAFAESSGGVDILVNNAGVGLEKPLVETSVEEWEQVMAVNVRGVFLCAKHAAAAMRGRGGGAIVNIGSIEGLGANPLHAAYAASKGAVHSLTRNLALELGADNIRCNAVAPGWIETPFNENLIAQYPDPQAARDAIKRLHPVRRMGTPDDIAALVMWLASDACGFASGQVYVHDGGRTACLPLPPLSS